MVDISDENVSVMPPVGLAGSSFSAQMSSPHKSSVPAPLNEYEVPPSGCEAHWEVVERILFIYAKLNPGIAYVQGMNEIVGPLYYTFATDPDSEWKGKRALGCPHFLLLTPDKNGPRKAGPMGSIGLCHSCPSLGLHFPSIG